MPRLTGLLLGLFFLQVVSPLAAEDTSPPSPSSLTQLQATWRTVASRVVGAPEPPPPYRVARTLPKLQLSNPLTVVREPHSSRLYFIDNDKNYRLRRTTEDPARGEFETLLDFDRPVAYSLAFHPKFTDNGFLYVGSNDPVSADGKTKMSRITRYVVGRQPPWTLDPASARIIIEWESNGHDGAAIAFGLDGLMYVTSGDGTSDSDTNLKGQGLDHLLAKVLRIDVDHPAADQAYSVPADNPFVGIAGARPETWAYGLRNPWRMTVDPQTGHLWVGNNGQDLWEQIYLVQRGDNYGWSVYEGSHIFYANRQLGPTPVTPPTFEHPHSEARSLTGGVVYYGSKFPDLRGAYLYGDYSTGKIWGARVSRDNQIQWHQELADSTLTIAAFALDDQDELLIVDHRANQQGGFYTLERNDEPDTSDQFPRLLSQTGLFASVAGHRVTPGLIPYSVNAPLWSDGAQKERYLYLPPTMQQGTTEQPTMIGLNGNRGWNFPDHTVLVKSFALADESVDDSSDTPQQRWIETRLLTKQSGEWVGYSYAWNDEQTEATLVAKEGLDREFEVPLTDGETRVQTWRFPSRTECMVCHSRAANYVLGLSTLQMNKEHDYAGTTRNQLEAWHEFGILPATKPETLPRLVDPYDNQQDLEARARSYLHANCAQCHIEAGGGNAQIDLEFTKSLAAAKLLDVEPLHHKFDVADARLIAPGDPDRSVLLHRVALRGSGQMPQLATSHVDQAAVALLRAWISQLKPRDATNDK